MLVLLDARINTHFAKLNENDLHIAHFINTHIELCKTLKIQDLAAHTNTSNATIHRFTKKLDFDGYSDFKSYLKFKSLEVTQPQAHDTLDEFKQDVENTFSYLARIHFDLLVQRIAQAETVYLYGTGRAQRNVAEEAQRTLLTIHKNVIILHDQHEFKMVLNQTTSKDVYFIISLSGHTPQLLEILQLLKSRQQFVVSVTTFQDNLLAQHANENVYVSSKTFKLKSGADYASFISYHIFFEMLLRYYNMHTPTASRHV